MKSYVKHNNIFIPSEEFLQKQDSVIRNNLSKLFDELSSTGTLSGTLCDYAGDNEWVVQVKNAENILQIFRIGLAEDLDSLKEPFIDHRDRPHPPILNLKRKVLIVRPESEVEIYVIDGYTRDIQRIDTWSVDEFAKKLPFELRDEFNRIVSEIKANLIPKTVHEIGEDLFEFSLFEPSSKSEIKIKAKVVMAESEFIS